MRGDVRAAVLALLAEEPRHGYAIMSEITERSGGIWRPSPGSVYPVLQQLQDEGLVSVTESDGRRVFSLTEIGRAYVEEHRDAIGRPWELADSGPGRRVRSLMEGMAALGAAVHQVARLADDAQAERAAAALEEARRTMYRILAGDDVPPPARHGADDVRAEGTRTGSAGTGSADTGRVHEDGVQVDGVQVDGTASRASAREGSAEAASLGHEPPAGGAADGPGGGELSV